MCTERLLHVSVANGLGLCMSLQPMDSVSVCFCSQWTRSLHVSVANGLGLCMFL